MSDLATEVETIAVPISERAGLEVVDVQVRGSGKGRVVRVLVDRKGGASIDRIQDVASDLSTALDEEDPIPGQYFLEVSSPGTDYALSGPRDFDRVEGRPVLVQHDAGDGRVLQTRGTVRAAENDAVVLDVDGAEHRIAYELIVKATQSLPW